MTKPTGKPLFRSSEPAAETKLDKTTRIVREITEGEAEQRQVKMARLRKARLERDAKTLQEPTSPERRSARTTAKDNAMK